jgi:hypothetical protein
MTAGVGPTLSSVMVVGIVSLARGQLLTDSSRFQTNWVLYFPEQRAFESSDSEEGNIRCLSIYNIDYIYIYIYTLTF